MSTRTTLTEALQRGRGVERPFNCPVHDDHNASASLNVVKNVWFCFSCGASGRAVDRKKAPTPSETLAVLMKKEKPRVFPERWLDVYDTPNPSPYWVERVGLTVARMHRCGTDPMSGMPTYPVRDAYGRVLGVVYRALDDVGPKYMYPPNVSTSHTLFNWPYTYTSLPRGMPVVLVEGAGDVMAVESAFLAHRVHGALVLGTYGAGLHYPQVELLEKLRPSLVVAAFDADDAGKKAALRAEATASQHVWPFVSVDWSEMSSGQGTDPGDIPSQDVVTILSTALEGSTAA